MSNPNRQFNRNFKPVINGAGPSEIMQRAAKAVTVALPKEWGFALVAFPMDSREGGLRYVSNGSRENVLKLLKDFVTKEEARIAALEKPQPPAPEQN